MNAGPDSPDTKPRCPECGATIDGDAPEGLCPRCLLRLARDFSELDSSGLDPESPLGLGHFADDELLAEIGPLATSVTAGGTVALADYDNDGDLDHARDRDR